MNQSLDSGTIFLEEFIKRIIIKSKSLPKIEKKEVLLEKLEEVAIIPPKLEIKPKIEPVKKIEPFIPKKPIQPAMPPKVANIEYVELSKLPPAKPAAPPMPQVPKISAMDRLIRIFYDPAVQVVNCPGPNKNILITRMGMVQTSPISLSENEIKEFMKELSEKTRIPLIPGLIKVMYQNLIITAVVSEFVGTKFIAERRLQLAHAPPRMQFR